MKNKLSLLAFILCLLSSNLHAADSSKMLLGPVEIQSLLQEKRPFKNAYQDFNISKSDRQKIANLPGDFNVEVFFGSWCHDSQREVPRFAKLMENQPSIQVEYHGLDYSKQDPNGLAKSKNIKYTPTFVFYRNGQEIGRIIERPETSLLQDTLQIVLTVSDTTQ